MTSKAAPIVADVLMQHADEARILYELRTRLAEAPHAGLKHLRRFDQRLAAHLEALSIAGRHSWPFLHASFDPPTPGAVFVATVTAIAERHGTEIAHQFALAEAMPPLFPGLIDAFGWVERTRLHGLVKELFDASEPSKRMIAVSACSAHRVDPGLIYPAWFDDSSPLVRSRALRAAAELGRTDLLRSCVGALEQRDPHCRFWAAWAGVLLGDRAGALEALSRLALIPGEHQARAFQLSMQAMSMASAHEVLQQLATDPAQLRWLILGSGIVGDPVYVPWLIKQMTADATARIAGEAFTLITGVDIEIAKLDRQLPGAIETGPNDNPDDENVELDVDDGLPWADGARVQQWWEHNRTRFQSGIRSFMGAPVTREHCLSVLENARQRQRMLAADYLGLLDPGTPLFSTSAPAWRQRKMLAA